MNQKSKFGLIAVILSIISTLSIIGGYSLSSNYHCDDPNWLANSEWKKGAYPAMAPDIHFTPIQACKSYTGNIMMFSFFLGMMMPWMFFAVWVGIWKSDIADEQFEQFPRIQNLCKIHFNEIVTKFIYVHKFQIQYKDNLGKCSLCPRDATCQFIKNEQQNQTEVKQS